MHNSVFVIDKLFIVVRCHRHFFFLVIVSEAVAQIVSVVFSFIGVMVVVIRCGCVELDRVVKHHHHFLSLCVPSHRSLLLSFKYDATKNFFTSRHEILATGCIQAPPKASNLFHGVASLAAFHFVLEVVFCFFEVEPFLDAIEDALVF
jgi:hypothetical protein